MDNIGEEREEIEEDIERLNLALQAEGAGAGLQDEEEDILSINDGSLEHEDYESVDTVFSIISHAKQGAPSEIDQFSEMSEISHLPINAETCLALNRTYQELVLESLKRIDVALNENREKQKILEEGLEMKTKGGSKSTQKQGNKKKSSSLFCKPYFKDKDHKVPPPNSDVEMKKMNQEHKQDVTPPMPWSIAQRCKLQDAVREEAMKQKLVPLMNRKEVYVEKVKKLESELLKINMEKTTLEEEEIKNAKKLNDLGEKGNKLEQEFASWQEKIDALDREMEKVKETSEVELLFSVDSEKVDWLMIANVICPNETEKEYLEAAISRGDITWHAGPMNMQLENMNELLFQMSLNISFELDKKYGIKRLFPTLSQRDVPGLTQAVIPSLVQRGISAVSVGVNPGSSPPAVPPLFRWSFEDDEVMATWHPGGYPLKPGPNPAHPGGLSTKDCVVMKGFEHALCFAFISDNGGPPKDIVEILGYYEILRKEFPNAKIKGSTFEEYFGEVDKIRNRLPIIREEVGDTWIQGIASDPFKMASYRAISEAVTQCISAGVCKMSDPDIVSAVRLLIKLPEHTWGLPSVGDNVNWSNPQFDVARSGEHYKNCEKAWQEQRAFLWMAMDQLRNVQALYDMIVQGLSQLVPQEPNLSEYEIVSDTSKTFTCEDGMKLKFQKDGSIQSLYDPYNMVEWATDAALGQFLYFTYNETDFMDMAYQYNYYGGAGYDKKNSTQNAHPESRPWPTVISQMYKAKKSALGSCDILLKLVMVESKSHTWYGAPESVWLHYKSRPEGYDVTLQWTNKTPTRLAESIMYNFNPAQKKGFNWRLSKVGHLVDPGNVILNGSQYVHAVDSGVYYINNKGQGLQLLTQDVPLVSIATKERPPSPFPVPLKPISQKDISGMAFNLYNNIWDTNYILWYPYYDGMNSSKPGNFKARFQINFYVP